MEFHDIASANRWLRDQGYRVTIELRGRLLCLRAAFPPLSGSPRRQRRLSLGLSESQISEAVDRAVKLGQQLKAQPKALSMSLHDIVKHVYSEILQADKEVVVEGGRVDVLGEGVIAEIKSTTATAADVHQLARYLESRPGFLGELVAPGFASSTESAIAECRLRGLRIIRRRFTVETELGEVDRQEIIRRLANGETQISLAAEFKVSRTTIQRFGTNETGRVMAQSRQQVVTYQGREYRFIDLCRLMDKDPARVRSQIKRGWSLERAIENPGCGTWQRYQDYLRKKRA